MSEGGIEQKQAKNEKPFQKPSSYIMEFDFVVIVRWKSLCMRTTRETSLQKMKEEKCVVAKEEKFSI